MLKSFGSVLLMVAFPVLMYSQGRISIEQLKQQITDTLSRQKGVFAVAFKDLSSGKEIFINEHENFHAASTMKVPVMIEIFKQAAEKKFSLTDSVVIKNEFKSIVDGSPFFLYDTVDSEHELYRQLGKKKTIEDLIYQMITMSSDLAANILIELVNAKNVTQSMRETGAKDIQVLRGVEDQKAFDKGLNNTTTAYDLALIFEKMATGKIVNKKADEAMIKILLDQTFNDVIPARLPAAVKIAHKTGWIISVHHDAGIVFLPDGHKYVLVLLSKKWEDEKTAVNAMASVSEMIYKYMKN